ncbi:YhgE/Pip family protein [Microbacterium sp. P04]|uniref:YhgE/Pip domain-containing protein n=1 Tax=Microbacterium sp. P04 TaxID=3366947 RepID=UPI003744B52B
MTLSPSEPKRRTRRAPRVERAASRRPITWLTIVGALLLPVIIGGILVSALYNPVDRLEDIPAAIVNDDEPVTLNDQVVPLGRQLTAGLIEGSDDLPSNLDWTITNDEDAAAGLADGTYAAVVTIPENFSAAATSTAPGSTPEQATISVTTPPDSLVVDDAISAQVTQAAASLTGQMLSTTYLENVFLGFTTLGDQLGTAADGASDLSDGARSAADGATSLADGVGQLATGADALASGATALASGATQLSTGATQAAAGVDALSSGASEIATSGRALSDGVQAISSGLPADLPGTAQQLEAGATGVAGGTTTVQSQTATAAEQLQTLATDCAAADSGVPADFCARVSDASDDAQVTAGTAAQVASGAGALSAGVVPLARSLPQLGAGLQTIGSGQQQLAGGLDQLSAGAATAADGVSSLADGAASLSTGAGQLSTGASQLADGADAASTGAADLAGGVGQVADGAASLASGLRQAADSLPSYTDAQASSLASVVADPVAAEGINSNLFGGTAIPLLATAALWFGGLGTFVALRAVSSRVLSSRRPSALLALSSLAPAAAIGAAQGLLVAVVVQFAASYDWADWSLFAVLCVVAGVAFATVHQALVAVFGGAGRWIAAIVGVLAVATGIVSTVPGVLMSVASLAPTSPAYQGMVAALTSAGGFGAAVVGLVIWSVLAFIVTTVAVARRRSLSTRQVLSPVPA